MFVFSDKVSYFADEKHLWDDFFPTFVLRDQIYLKTNTMNTKKFFYGVLTFLVLFLAACTSNTAEDDELYERGIDKKDIILDGIDKKDIIIDNIDKKDIILDAIDKKDVIIK